MEQSTLKPRTIFCHDNLSILRGINSNSIDLIYLDPPFNKGRNFHAPIGTTAEGADFKDIWSPDDVKEEWHNQINDRFPALYKYLDAVGDIGSKSAKSYLIYMGVRLIEIHRILKDTGSIYLHCDPTASHYLKLLLDTIFGHANFKNEITWQRSNPHNDAKKYGNIVDIILFYTKTKKYCWNATTTPLTEKQITEKYKHKDAAGRNYRPGDLHATGLSGGGYQYTWNGVDRLWRTPQANMQTLHDDGKLHYSKSGTAYTRIYLDEHEGIPLQSIWTDIPHVSGKERKGYPTQKPVALLERIISASLPKDGVVLDPFCGCATTCIAAEKFEQQWVGIDISAKAYELVIERIEDELPADLIRKTPFFRKDIPQRTDVSHKPAPTKENKQLLYGKQNGTCAACETKFDIRHLEVDHIIPKSQGGGHEIENLQLLCANCNRMKGDRPMEYLMARLKLITQKMRI